MMYGQALTNDMNNGNPADAGATVQGTEITQEKVETESSTEPPDNELIDFDAF